MMITALVVASPALAINKTDVRELRASKSAEMRVEFKAKLAKIRDEKKKAIVEKLDARFAEVNEKRTNQMSGHLYRMSGILDKVTGKDVTAARAAIQVASTAVSAQAAKSYLITITTEANLKMDVGKVRSQLESDLRVVHQLVIEARKAVQAVIK